VFAAREAATTTGDPDCGSEIRDVVRELFAANALSPLLLVWIVAALLQVTQGGSTVAGIIAIGMIAALVADLEASPVLIALTAGTGACFGG
jgi:H+/gluconate symporter-like permease